MSALHSFRHAPEQFSRTISLGKQGSFYADELISQPYGLTYEIVEKRLNVIPPCVFQEVGMICPRYVPVSGYKLLRVEDTDATNELINDSQVVQPLTIEEIEELKRTGVHVSVRQRQPSELCCNNDRH